MLAARKHCTTIFIPSYVYHSTVAYIFIGLLVLEMAYNVSSGTLSIYDIDNAKKALELASIKSLCHTM